ncbi:ABC transporter permease [Xinfangfangia sp. CPCC 101601]|uniref:ABC transporter permease n=1 Tax=Pseudogemmobacter lacusdianii TaxID=3069608 RepID=A0ABU0VTS1_9RHOB|nr:ABC transporter permease [Xinfangfangia sp. CPCC 101601]MDQ2065129.1 ABC transporter permease [Xinfangfangia sp. CPCC 101601]
MLAYVAKRVTLAIIVIFTVIAAMFVMMHAVPGDPVRSALGPRASEAMIEAYRIKLGFDLPIWEQLLRYYGAILRGDLGQDVISGTPVLRVILSQLPDTLMLIAGAMSVAVIPGIYLGVVAASRRGGAFDRVSSVLAVSVMAVPSFVIAIYLLLIFSISLGWFPAIGAGEGVAGKLQRLVLPSIALGLAWIGYLSRILRASMLEVMAENHVRTARAFGISRRKIMHDYVLRIAILPTITVLGMGIGQMISGAVFAEIVFGRPGVGKLVYDAIANRNYPIVTGTVLVTTTFFVLIGLIADLLIAFLDPRVRNVITR